MASVERVWVYPSRARLLNCTTADSFSNILDPKAALSASRYPFGSRHIPHLSTRSRFEEISLRGDPLFHFFEDCGCSFDDIGSTLSGMGFEIYAKRSYQFSLCIMQRRSSIKAIRFMFHKWLELPQRDGFIFITFFSQ